MEKVLLVIGGVEVAATVDAGMSIRHKSDQFDLVRPFQLLKECLYRYNGGRPTAVGGMGRVASRSTIGNATNHYRWWRAAIAAEAVHRAGAVHHDADVAIDLSGCRIMHWLERFAPQHPAKK